LQIKLSVTGYGTAEKHQVQELVRLLLKLDTIPKPDHVADSLAAAICLATNGATENRLRI
jgi:crossover junction endodeoxyribonuclease RuvC